MKTTAAPDLSSWTAAFGAPTDHTARAARAQRARFAAMGPQALASYDSAAARHAADLAADIEAEDEAADEVEVES